MVQRIVQRLRAKRRDEAGIAMILVMASITVLSLLVTAALGYALQAQPQARRDQDWNAALAAAQAGVDDYVARLNQNDSYYTSVDCTNPAMKGPKSGTNTCGWTAATAAGWQNVVAGNSSQGTFHYDVDSSTILSQGTIRVTSTGKVRKASRTVQVLVSRGGSTQYLYYTDFEDADPSNQSAYGNNPGGGDVVCGASGPTSASYWWQGNARNASNCVEITFVTGDTLDGAVHFNDTPLVSGTPLFKKAYETSDPACKTAVVADDYSGCWRGNSATPGFNGSQPTYAAQLYLPDNSTSFGAYPGCDYTGDTRIRFNSDGTMTVWDKGSVGTTVGAGCGTPTALGLASAAGQVVNVPNDQTIYVANAATQSKCATGQVGDGIPLAGDVNVNLSTFYCGNGNAYVEGTLKGRVTLAAQNNVIVTGDLLLSSTALGAAPTGSDMLGLVASNSVVNYHPVNSSGNNLIGISDRWIYASIQTLQHSFWVESYDQGTKLGTLHVRGSIAQRWRGIVGTGGASGTGYLKDYSYDSRLTFASPPYFPQWTNAVWGAKTTGELAPAY
jgi:Tfp pilus assembly protein PilX